MRYLIIWSFLVLISLGWGPQQALSQKDNWQVRNRNRRHKVILKRFLRIVEQNPERGFAYKRLIQVAQKWPGLDVLIKRYKK